VRVREIEYLLLFVQHEAARFDKWLQPSATIADGRDA